MTKLNNEIKDFDSFLRTVALRYPIIDAESMPKERLISAIEEAGVCGAWEVAGGGIIWNGLSC